MKFLLELVPCFGHHQLAADEPRVEETRTLMRAPSRRRRKRVRVSGGAAAAEWRPSLSSISEDIPPPQQSEKSSRCVGDERKVRRKSGGGGGGGGGWSCHVRGRSDDFGRSAFESMIPAFSPTPFMF